MLSERKSCRQWRKPYRWEIDGLETRGLETQQSNISYVSFQWCRFKQNMNNYEPCI